MAVDNNNYGRIVCRRVWHGGIVGSYSISKVQLPLVAVRTWMGDRAAGGSCLWACFENIYIQRCFLIV